MPLYGVEVPIAGYIYVEVEADNKNEAFDKAMEYQWNDDDIQELDSYEKIVEGNVCHLWHYRISAREITD